VNAKKSQSPLQKALKSLNPSGVVGELWVNLNNERRKSEENLDYVLMTLPDVMPALPQTRGFIRRRVLGEPPLSLWELDRRFRRIGDDPRTKGVILHLRGFGMPLADLQTLRDSIQKLRDKGKRVICFAQNYDLAMYYVASVADEIIIQPGGNVFTVGLRQEAVFLKDALARVGITVDSIAISPYKGAADALTRSEISPEGQEQLEWLLDSRYDMIVEGIAQGRGFAPEKVREMIDNAPYLDTFAKGIAMIDAIRTEEELYGYLDTQHILTWEQADGKLYLKHRKPQDKYVALLPIEGLMVPGESVTPPGQSPIPVPIVQDGRVGDITVVRQVRALMQDENVAALVLFVDSGGGAAVAAEAMQSALRELAQKVPVVVYMNGVAASGGYLVATAGQYIIAQPGTITGSIGVLLSKPVAGELREMLKINALAFKRGENADILSTTTPFSDGQREWLRESISRTYDLFVEKVARARSMEREAVEPLAGGRVWTGTQALENGLVDELGGLKDALRKARELANLPDDTPVGLVQGKDKPLPPQVAEQANPAAHIAFLRGNIDAMTNAQPMLLTPVTLRDEVSG
jgi:protease-4